MSIKSFAVCTGIAESGALCWPQ